MEPALPPLHPKLPRLLEQLGLRPIDAIKWNVILCNRKDDDSSEMMILKFGSDERKAASIAYEVKLLRGVLPDINQDDFERLVMPEYVDDGIFEDVQWVLMRYIKGHPLAHEWSELSFKPEILGGKNIDVAVSSYAVDVLRDLRVIDVETMPKYVHRFRFEDWRQSFSEQSEELIEKKLLKRETVERAAGIFSSLPSYRYDGNMFTNGDFYPRNFIVLEDGKIAVADWVGGVDPWSFVAMHAWLMMWGNPKWQSNYIKKIVEHFPIDFEEMQAGLLVESFKLVYRWRDEPEETIGLARSQMLAYFHQCLDLNYVQGIFAV